MSRTYRRKGKNNEQTCRWLHHEWLPAINGGYRCVRHKKDKSSLEYKKDLVYFHSDSGYGYRYWGPSWFANMVSNRPLRALARQEIIKFLKNPDYEPMIPEKIPLDYWD